MASAECKREIEDPKQYEVRRMLEALERKFVAYIIFAVIYGVVFINYIDIVYSGHGYHLWLIAMYFVPFIALSIFNLRKNWRLTLGLGFIASLMNDLFYGVIRFLIGMPVDLVRYYSLWLIPHGDALFSLNLGFATIQVYSWMMALSIYARIILAVALLWTWKLQAKERCISGKEPKRKPARTIKEKVRGFFEI